MERNSSEHNLSLRGESGSGRRGNPSCKGRTAYGSLTGHSGSPRAFALAMTEWVRYTRSLSLRGESGSGRRGNPLNAMGAYGQYGSLTGSQWIATGLRPRDDKVVINGSMRQLCHCEEGT